MQTTTTKHYLKIIFLFLLISFFFSQQAFFKWGEIFLYNIFIYENDREERNNSRLCFFLLIKDSSSISPTHLLFFIAPSLYIAIFIRIMFNKIPLFLLPFFFQLLLAFFVCLFVCYSSLWLCYLCIL